MISKQSKQKALQQVLYVTTTESATVVTYIVALLGIASLIPNISLPPLIAGIAGGLGVEAMGQILAKVSEKDLSNKEILEEIDQLFNNINIESLLTQDAFFNAYARIRHGQRNLSQQNQHLLEVVENHFAVTEVPKVLSEKQEIRYLRQTANQAAMNLHLPNLNRILGDAQSLQDSSLSSENTAELSALVVEIQQLRSRLRDRLGAASTLLVCGNARYAYTVALDWMDRGVPVFVDNAGNFGRAGGEVETYRFFQTVRKMFLSNLIDLVEQRRNHAKGLKEKSPKLALEILNDALSLLSDEILLTEDKVELKFLTDSVNQEILEISTIWGQS